ncbi:MAG: hypothetical protein NC548_37000, partial [Lachnospiraceae bacterium]|nr:hypothetical protein [Lachnospiraceae bacterium]
MPWVLDENGNKKYTPSIYAKEELPTWNEFYNEFYKSGNYTYDGGKDVFEIDPYWKIPRKKYLLAVA